IALYFSQLLNLWTFLFCSICLDLLKDPVAIPCGHSYCMSCITGCSDQDDQKGLYSCPQCRQTFTPRPVLGKNTMLAEVLEKLKKTKLQAARPAQCFAGSGDVDITMYASDTGHDEAFPIATPRGRSVSFPTQGTMRFTLDPNTAHKRLYLSEGNRVFTDTQINQPYPDHPERFDAYLQVLCRECVCGHCYWEVGWTGHRWLSISVSYKSIGRKGDCAAISSSSRIGVYVDHGAGTLSFYRVSDPMTLIHRVHTTFTQPLYPAFWIDPGIGVRLFDP
uniref:RING-type domain-containing protein n=1 Tax=Sinocyclocheilus anshuiensis TaxID=1608454 RepID=A0A671K5T5_9TELE